MNFKVGDILICRKTSIPKPHNDSDWVPCIYMFQGVEYIVVGVDDEDIHMVMATEWERRYTEPVEMEFFGFDDRRVNHWERWFLTKAELRERQLKLLGI